MSDTRADPLHLLFDGFDKLGPGSDAETRKALRCLPEGQFQRVIDAGCGRGRQTLVLAAELDTVIDAVDLHQPFLDRLRERAAKVGLGHRVRTHCLDMCLLGERFEQVDLIWSEGAAYAIGFATAMHLWSQVLRPGGFAVVSECSWLGPPPGEHVRRFWEKAYPTMASVDRNVAFANAAGMRVLDTFVLSEQAWIEDYYDGLESRANELLAAHGDDDQIKALAEGTLEEIEAYRTSRGSFGYVFYVMQAG